MPELRRPYARVRCVDESKLSPVAAAASSIDNGPSKQRSFDKKYDEKECICHRPKGKIKCFICDYSSPRGRKVRPCPQHLNQIFLSDWKACPQCQNDSLVELGE